MKYLLIVSLLLIGCAQGKDGAAAGSSPSGPTAELYIFGDDISAGTGATVTYGSLLQTRSGLTLRNYAYAGAGGATATLNNSVNVYAGAAAWSLNHFDTNMGPEDTVIIFVGYTDARWYGGALPVNHLEDFLVPILNKVKASGAKLYVVGTIAMPLASYAMYAPLNNGSDVAMTTVNNAISAKVTALAYARATFVNALTQFNAVAGNFGGSYPNNAGHVELSNIISTAMGI